MQEIQEIDEFKTHAIPLARIKKVMKLDEDVKVCKCSFSLFPLHFVC